MKKLTSNKTKKGEFGIGICKNKKVFYKVINCGFDEEIRGYNCLKEKHFKIANRLFFNSDENLIVYDYIKSLDKNIFHKTLYSNKRIAYKRIVKLLLCKINDIENCKLSESVNSRFFTGRIGLLDKYINSNVDKFNKTLIINGVVLPSLHDSFLKIKEFILSDPVVKFAITQGDPTDLNFSQKGFITDFEVAGKNAIINDIAIFLGCFIVNSYYYYIKFIKSAHSKEQETFHKFKKYINCEYLENNEGIVVNTCGILPKRNKKLVLKYLYEIKKHNLIKPDIEVGKLIAFRFCNPVDITQNLTDKEFGVLAFLISMFANKALNLDDVIKFIGGI